MSTESQLRADIVEVGRRMYARGYTASNDGNISVRLGDPTGLLMTPKSVCKGFMTPDMMCITDLDGRKLQGDRDPSSEMLMHLEVYRQRPDVQAVVHAHPPTATGFAVAGIPLDRAVLAEVLTHARQHSDRGVRDAVDRRNCPTPCAKYIKAHDGMLLANHGALTVGARSVLVRTTRWRPIEHFAKISLVARMLGRENLIAARGGPAAAGAAGTLTASRRRRRFAPTTRPRAARIRVVPGACRRRTGGGCAPRCGSSRSSRLLATNRRRYGATRRGKRRRRNSVNIPRTFRVD